MSGFPRWLRKQAPSAGRLWFVVRCLRRCPLLSMPNDSLRSTGARSDSRFDGRVEIPPCARIGCVCGTGGEQDTRT